MKKMKKLSLVMAIASIVSGVTANPTSATTKTDSNVNARYGIMQPSKPMFAPDVIDVKSQPTGFITGPTILNIGNKKIYFYKDFDLYDVTFRLNYSYDRYNDEITFNGDIGDKAKIHSNDLGISVGHYVNFTFKMKNVDEDNPIKLTFKRV
ncbi:MAG: hypothetical protein ACLU6S_13305 [Clostridium sp.]|uniref:hypothetical protein n=1 Tax=Clostridium sp. TaxID=1506 RepID=UPI00399C021B